MEIIAERLKVLRESVGLSQNKLGKLFGLPQATINRYEHDQTTPSTKAFLQYADYFNVSLDYIFGRTDNPHGAFYDDKPKVSPEMEKFIEMCFDPKTKANALLKDSLIRMLAEETKKNE